MAEQASQVAKENERKAIWKKSHAMNIQFMVADSTGIPSAIRAACEATGMTVSQYARNAIVQALQWDGFNPENFKPDRADNGRSV